VNPLDVPEVGAAIAYNQWQRGEIALLDVREKSEWDLGHIDGSEFIPLGQLLWRRSELDRTKKWVCVCHIGARSYHAAALMRHFGYDAASMEGGMVAWQANGLPITEPGIVESP
jgi:rhodanese-related sulfurtransferase